MKANKRQKISLVCGQSKKAQKSVSESFQCHTLDTLPPEVLEIILRLLPFHDVASAVRLVSRRCSTVAMMVLNGGFFASGTRLEVAMKDIEARMSNVKTDAELLAYSRVFNALEVIKVQYKLLRAVTWRYTHHPNQEKFPRFCFYAGSLLDDLNTILYQITKHPETLIESNDSETSIACFIAVCKRFMNHFEKVSERRINRSAFVSGCKIVDILDCITDGRQVLFFKVSPGKEKKNSIINMKLKYVMKRAWFTCLKVFNTTGEQFWRDEQRFMYLRLRRLVYSVNDHLLEDLHYERELLLQAMTVSTLPPSRPPASTYSGYGEYGGQFFFYGNMNKYAYASKFKFPEGTQLNNNADETEANPTLCFDLVITVEFKCTPDLAPFEVGAALRKDELDTCNSKSHQEIYLRLNVTCPASVANRLPGNFTWEVRSPRRTHCSF